MHLSKSQKIPFYSNFKKKISQWQMPSKEDGNEVPEGWKEMRSSKCNTIYYKNTKTNDVQWINPIESVNKYFMIVTTMNNDNDRLKELYIKNYSYDKKFTPEYRYRTVMSSQDMWFHLVNSNDMIIGSCSVKIEDNTYIFDDVYIEEEFRGNNYANLLLLNAMKSVRTNNINASFQISAHDDNIPAVKTYSKIFGEPIRVEKNEFVYYGITENELEMQLKKVPLVILTYV
jgi:predicted GNAT family N-acyltransferase